MMFGVFHKLEDNCVIKACGNNENNQVPPRTWSRHCGRDAEPGIEQEETNTWSQVLSYRDPEVQLLYREAEIDNHSGLFRRE